MRSSSPKSRRIPTILQCERPRAAMFLHTECEICKALQDFENFPNLENIRLQFDKPEPIHMKQVSVDNVVSTYRFYAPLYDRVFGTIFEPGRRALAEAACSIRPNSLLEVGVGTGLTLSQYPGSAEIVGIDVSSDMLDIARWRA